MKIIKCVCCNKEIKELDTPFNEDKLNEGNWNGGSVMRLNCSYGSSFDGDMFYIGICDSCLISKRDDNTIVYIGNYLCL
jgi:hypothetical protein